MSLFIKELVKMKLKQLSYQDLLNYSIQYDFSLTKMQAQNIIEYIHTNDFDPFDESDRIKISNELAQITDQATATQANLLFNELISSYGLEYLFE